MAGNILYLYLCTCIEKHAFKSSTMSHSKLCKRAIALINLTSLTVLSSTLWMESLNLFKRFLSMIKIMKSEEPKPKRTGEELTSKVCLLILYEIEYKVEPVHTLWKSSLPHRLQYNSNTYLKQCSIVADFFETMKIANEILSTELGWLKMKLRWIVWRIFFPCCNFDVWWML